MYYLTDTIHYYIFVQNNQLYAMVKLKDGFTGERALVLPRMIVDKMEEDPLTSMLHITDIGYYPKAKYHFRERKEPINQLDGLVLYHFLKLVRGKILEFVTVFAGTCP